MNEDYTAEIEREYCAHCGKRRACGGIDPSHVKDKVDGHPRCTRFASEFSWSLTREEM